MTREVAFVLFVLKNVQHGLEDVINTSYNRVLVAVKDV